MTDEPCAVCGSVRLQPRLRVAGDAGSEGLIPTTERFGIALADIVRCPTCGHMQLERMPSDADLRSAYGDAASEDYVEEEAGQRETARRTLARIERHRPPGDLLDLGCWVGFLMAVARERGWRPLGVEPSAFAAAYARDRLGLDVIEAALFEAPLEDRTFDVVALGDVIEHLPRPGEALDRIHGLLRDGGLLWMALPDAGSAVAALMGRRWWSVIPTHVQYFTRASVRRLLESHGFEVLEVATAPKAFTVRYYLERIAGYAPWLSRALVAAAQRVGLAERMWAPDFRDRMQVLARRVSG